MLYDLVKRGAYNLQEKRFLKADDLALKQQVSSSLLVCIADTFEEKLRLALQTYPAAALAFVGGVACNKYIRGRLTTLAQEKGIPFFTPSPAYCTDNGAMIAFVGHYKAQKQEWDDFYLDIKP